MFNRRHYSILSERYFECLLGDFSSLLWMTGQAPLVAGLIILRWKSWQATDSLYFIMALSAVWFGCINSCREIAKELPIYQRERLFGLDRAAYLASKIKVLNLLGLVEMGLFAFLLNSYLDLDLQIALAFVALLCLYFAGSAMGLFLSRWLGSVARAVISVPIAILPQIVFSKFVLPESSLRGVAEKIANLMIAKWGFEALTYSRRGEIHLGNYFLSLVCLFALAVVFLLLTWLHLRFLDAEATVDS